MKSSFAFSLSLSLSLLLALPVHKMGKGAKAANGVSRIEPRQITFDEFNKHNKKDDQWLMIGRKAYNVTEFAKRHPGGAKILNHYAGEDATVSCGRTRRLFFVFLCSYGLA